MCVCIDVFVLCIYRVWCVRVFVKRGICIGLWMVQHEAGGAGGLGRIGFLCRLRIAVVRPAARARAMQAAVHHQYR